ncbi:MAG: T9SS type A sorting domain-containing protein [Saprospiraceae bacterium]
MRIFLLYIPILLFTQTISAQVQFEPLGSNPVLQRAAAKKQQEQLKIFKKLAGEEEVNFQTRALDCDNIDGAFIDGETLYVAAGDSIKICYNIEVYDTVADISGGLDHGTSAFNGSCIVYYADPIVTLGLGDVLSPQFCPDQDPANCFDFSFPIVVKRADMQFSFPLQTLVQDEIIEICIDDVQLEGEEIDISRVNPCQMDLLGEVYNGVIRDTCFVYAASRFAEVDSVCYEICDEYCICDQYTYYFNTITTPAPFPFMDDFSYDGPYPDGINWLNDNVFINATMGFQPPSVGVATFDGLDETGTPYGSGLSRSDFLTSSYFTFDEDDDEIWLSFWVQNKGYSYPSNPGDSIMVEFKNKNGDWIHKRGVNGENLLNDEFIPFEFYKIEVADNFIDTFLFDGFQFRFVNNGNSNTVQDTWHLDYVRLDQGEPDETFNDLAFSALPSDILEHYSSMPYWQFEGFAEEEVNDTMLVEISNLFGMATQANDTEVRHEELTTGTVFTETFEVENTPTLIGSLEYLSFMRFVPPTPLSNLETTLENEFSGADYLEVERTYELVSSNSQATAFDDVLRNDQVKRITYFDNYFAYDDGSAEAAVSLPNSIGPMVAVRFHANVADTLRGFSMHFPHYGGASEDDLFNIKVWVGSLDSDPVYEDDLIRPYLLDIAFDSLQGFTTYRLEDFDNIPTPVAIPAGDFFIGWQNASSLKPVRVGWDRNTPNAFVNQFYANSSTGPWVTTADEGAYMLRAVVGSETPGVTKNKETEALTGNIKVYPNPASDQLFFQLASGNFDDYELSLHSISGQTILQQHLTDQLNVSHLPAGIYFVQLKNRDNGVMQVERVVLVD